MSRRRFADGVSSKEVASLLNLSTEAVETHLFNLMRKLSIYSIRDLVGYATKSNLIQIERTGYGFLEKGQWVNVSSELQPLHLNYPSSLSLPITRVRAANPDVILVDIPVDKSRSALRAIELLHREVPQSTIFAIGSLSQSRVIVNAIRAGAREFIERPTTTAVLLEAFARLTTRTPQTPRPELLS